MIAIVILAKILTYSYQDFPGDSYWDSYLFLLRFLPILTKISLVILIEILTYSY